MSHAVLVPPLSLCPSAIQEFVDSCSQLLDPSGIAYTLIGTSNGTTAAAVTPDVVGRYFVSSTHQWVQVRPTFGASGGRSGLGVAHGFLWGSHRIRHTLLSCTCAARLWHLCNAVRPVPSPQVAMTNASLLFGTEASAVCSNFTIAVAGADSSSNSARLASDRVTPGCTTPCPVAAENLSVVNQAGSVGSTVLVSFTGASFDAVNLTWVVSSVGPCRCP
jgi:hypothetical protein